VESTLDVVIVSYNTRDLLRRCLAALLRGQDPLTWADGCLGVIVVDNGSTDGSPDLVARDFPAVRLLRNATNRGYAVAMNQGIRAGTAPLVLSLNSDAVLARHDLALLRRLLEQYPACGLLGCRVVGLDGRAEPSCGRFPGLWPAVAGHLPRAWCASWRAYRSPRPCGDVLPVGWVSGVCCLARRAALAAAGAPADGGPLDGGFTMYFEDMDLCWRLRRAGWQIGYTERVSVVHAGSASWRGHEGRRRLARDASQIRYFLKRGQRVAASAARLRRALRLRVTRYYEDVEEGIPQ
jgi:GT2 family glycosyltransferase